MRLPGLDHGFDFIGNSEQLPRGEGVCPLLRAWRQPITGCLFLCLKSNFEMDPTPLKAMRPKDELHGWPIQLASCVGDEGAESPPGSRICSQRLQ